MARPIPPQVSSFSTPAEKAPLPQTAPGIPEQYRSAPPTGGGRPAFVLGNQGTPANTRNWPYPIPKPIKPFEGANGRLPSHEEILDVIQKSGGRTCQWSYSNYAGNITDPEGYTGTWTLSTVNGATPPPVLTYDPPVKVEPVPSPVTPNIIPGEPAVAKPEIVPIPHAPRHADVVDYDNRTYKEVQPRRPKQVSTRAEEIKAQITEQCKAVRPAPRSQDGFPAAGTILRRYCCDVPAYPGFGDSYVSVADGKGGSITKLIKLKDPVCQEPPPPPPPVPEPPPPPPRPPVPPPEPPKPIPQPPPPVSPPKPPEPPPPEPIPPAPLPPPIPDPPLPPPEPPAPIPVPVPLPPPVPPPPPPKKPPPPPGVP